MRLRVTKSATFAAAHHLEDYEGPCHRPHGHNYQVELTFSGEAGRGGIVA
ncbi:MAG: 6-carboxytetrahydropterin synthase, partial [bacterium]